MISRIGFLSLILLFLASCTTLSKNRIRKGSVVIRGGVFAEKTWSDTFEFRQASWYQELTLLYDVLIARVDSNTPFSNWFSSSSLDLVKKCQEFYVVLSYSQDTSKISNWMLFKEMRENGFRKVAIDTFKKNISLHPEWEDLNLSHYEVSGLCRMDKLSEKIIISFPGFTEMKL